MQDLHWSTKSSKGFSRSVLFLFFSIVVLNWRPCTASLQKFSHPGWYCDTKGYNTSAIKICHGIIPARVRELLERGCTLVQCRMILHQSLSFKGG